MNAPMVWIVFPIVVAVVAFIFRRWKRVISITLTIISLILVLFAWFIPIGELISIGPQTLTFSDRLIFAGRQFVLGNDDRPILIVVYVTLAFFFLGSLSARVSKSFAPLGFGMAAILIASMAVQPFLYAALLIEVAVLIGVLLLIPPGNQVQSGVLRYLTFLSFSMPFMLLAGWLLSNMGNEVSNQGDFLPVAVFLGIGFVFLLAIFPLNTWIPMLMESVNPYSAAFLITIFPFVVIGLLQRFLGRYPWLLDSDVILSLGIIMVVTGGLWAAFQRDLGRFLGYAVIIEIGRFLLAISQPAGEFVYEAILIPHILTLGLWALALSLLRTKVDDLRFESVLGIGRQFPLIALGVLTAHFSIAGFPLLASFPSLFALLEHLAQDSLWLALWALFGSAGLLLGGLRTMVVFVTGPDDLPRSGDIDRTSRVLLLLGTIAIVIVGMFPQSIITLFAKVSIDI